MALTITKDFPHAKKIGKGIYLLSGVISFDSSYHAGGEDVSGVTKYFKNCLRLICDQKSGFMFEFDKANKKLKAFHPTRINSASGTVNDALGYPTGSAVLTSATSARDISNAGKEVADTTDLSTLTGVSFIAVGLS